MGLITSVALGLLLIAGPQCESFAQSVGKLYAVIFDVSTDSAGRIESLQVAKVIDPSTGSTDPVQIPVPPQCISAAKTYLAARTYSPGRNHFNTGLFFDPFRPGKADIDPKSGRP